MILFEQVSCKAIPKNHQKRNHLNRDMFTSKHFTKPHETYSSLSKLHKLNKTKSRGRNVKFPQVNFERFLGR